LSSDQCGYRPAGFAAPAIITILHIVGLTHLFAAITYVMVIALGFFQAFDTVRLLEKQAQLDISD